MDLLFCYCSSLSIQVPKKGYYMAEMYLFRLALILELHS